MNGFMFMELGYVWIGLGLYRKAFVSFSTRKCNKEFGQIGNRWDPLTLI